MTKIEADASEAIAIAREARNDAWMAKTMGQGALQLAEDVRAMFRAHTTSLNKLRETQVEQGQRLDRLEGEMKAGLSKMSLGMDEIIDLLTKAERES